jgi:uncharacterized protein YggE
MRNKPLFLIPLLALVLMLSACGTASGSNPRRTLSVSGSGTVFLTPDIANIYLGVHTEETDIALALSKNNTQSLAVVEAMKNLGVAAEDIQTSNFSIWSRQDYDPLGALYTKYVVDNTVYIKVRNLAQLGSLLTTVVASGANNINSISFDVSDKSAAMAEARQKAMSNANDLAGELAKTAGVGVGEIQSITYLDYSPAPYSGMGGGGAAPQAAVPIQPGQLQISVTVNVSYAIK